MKIFIIIIKPTFLLKIYQYVYYKKKLNCKLTIYICKHKSKFTTTFLMMSHSAKKSPIASLLCNNLTIILGINHVLSNAQLNINNLMNAPTSSVKKSVVKLET